MQFIEETPAEQEARQRYNAQVSEVSDKIQALRKKWQTTLYLPASVAAVQQEMQQLEGELHRIHEAEEARIAALDFNTLCGS